MVIKYGKGYAMTETTLLICDFAEGINSAKKMAVKRKEVIQNFRPTYSELKTEEGYSADISLEINVRTMSALYPHNISRGIYVFFIET